MGVRLGKDRRIGAGLADEQFAAAGGPLVPSAGSAARFAVPACVVGSGPLASLVFA